MYGGVERIGIYSGEGRAHLLSSSCQEMDLLLTLAAPIEQRQRDKILHEVAAELEAAAQTGVGPGPGAVHRVVQRRFFDPPAWRKRI
jgi:hypothetical protein